MEGTQAGLLRQRLDAQVVAEMGGDEFLDPPETLRIERAAGRYRCRFQAGMMSEYVNT